MRKQICKYSKDYRIEYLKEADGTVVNYLNEAVNNNY